MQSTLAKETSFTLTSASKVHFDFCCCFVEACMAGRIKLVQSMILQQQCLLEWPGKCPSDKVDFINVALHTEQKALCASVSGWRSPQYPWWQLLKWHCCCFTQKSADVVGSYSRQCPLHAENWWRCWVLPLDLQEWAFHREKTVWNVNLI